MVLSGTLKEFILADVFQLLTQQKITGKLVLNDGHSEGNVLFKNGIIVGAEKEDISFTQKLSLYLIDVKKLSPEIVNGKISSFDENLSELTNELINKGAMTKKEMRSLAESVFEDITCSLFQWKHGTYNFASLRSIEHFIVCDVSFPVENIVMEAMRRVDEWNRMISVISDDSIFRIEEQPSQPLDQNPDPLKSIDQYVLSKINGITSVRKIVETTCLSQYKTYESLSTLIQNHQISALSAEDARIINESITSRTFNRSHPMFSIIFSSLTTVIAILIITVISQVIFKGIVFQNKTIESFIHKNQVQIKLAQINNSIADSYFMAENITKPTDISQLKKNKLLSSADIYYLKLDMKMKKKIYQIEKEK